jgi:hypothetical protein
MLIVLFKIYPPTSKALSGICPQRLERSYTAGEEKKIWQEGGETWKEENLRERQKRLFFFF